jgi:hypothetical protein
MGEISCGVVVGRMVALLHMDAMIGVPSLCPCIHGRPWKRIPLGQLYLIRRGSTGEHQRGAIPEWSHDAGPPSLCLMETFVAFVIGLHPLGLSRFWGQRNKAFGDRLFSRIRRPIPHFEGSGA